MPRIKANGRLIRTPMPAWAAFELTFYYPEFSALARRHIDAWLLSGNSIVKDIAVKYSAAGGKLEVTLRQKLVLLTHTYPSDSRLTLLQKKLAKEKFQFAIEVRENPDAAYAAEEKAVAFALHRLTEKGLSTVKPRVSPIDRLS